MTRPTWTYMLRLMRRNPDRLRMDRLGEYLREFADLLGTENEPVFKGIVRRSVGIKATVTQARQRSTHLRILEARTKPDSRAARPLRRIEALLGQDSISEAQLLDTSGKVVYLFSASKPQHEAEARVWQHGTVDGVVTGLVGADDTMHLYLRDGFDRDLKLVVRDESLARSLLRKFRSGAVRIDAHGTWVRTGQGWIPEASKCTVDNFESLDETSAADVFEALSSIDGNGWREAEDAQALWKEIRGIK